MISTPMKYAGRLAIALVLLSLALGAPAAADPARYASIRRDEAFLREGPSYAHKVLWVYRRKNFPVMIIGSFDAWRRVKDVDGTVGWMHHTQLSDARTVVFIGFTKSLLREDAKPSASIIAYVQPGVVAKLKACKPAVCEVETSGVEGWVNKKNIWGVELGEVF
jgi:SH3-like domain-containing protein